MTVHDKKLGERIRELRTRLGITQKELAGNRITRNMLSLIESGNASPSVSTLIYIAERLGTSAGYLFTSTEADEGRYFKLSVIDELKKLFREKDYHECESICETIPTSAWDDELSYIAASSYLHTALENADRFDLLSASRDLSKAKLHAAGSIYADEGFLNALDFYSELFRTVCSDAISERLCDEHLCSALVPIALIRYFRSLSAARNGLPLNDTFHQEQLLYTRHIEATAMLFGGQAEEASKLFRELSLVPELPYYMTYRVLCGLEASANGIGDFRLAYSASRRKLELIDRCKA